MSWLGDLLAETFWGVGRRVAKFTRRLSERQLLEEQAAWGHNHMGISASRSRCVVCERGPVRADERCPGPKATQRARALLKERFGVDVW